MRILRINCPTGRYDEGQLEQQQGQQRRTRRSPFLDAFHARQLLRSLHPSPSLALSLFLSLDLVSRFGGGGGGRCGVHIDLAARSIKIFREACKSEATGRPLLLGILVCRVKSSSEWETLRYWQWPGSLPPPPRSGLALLVAATPLAAPPWPSDGGARHLDCCGRRSLLGIRDLDGGSPCF